MRQGNDRGIQYRSGVYTFDAIQQQLTLESKKCYQIKLFSSGFNEITTEIINAPVFYYAEDYHQQYLAKNPQGYCGLGGVGVLFE
jgi:peptide-methionine (S)-S-oxide reductase